MTENYEGVNIYRASITIPAVGDARTAAITSAPLKELADRTYYLNNLSTSLNTIRTCATRAAITALSGCSNGEIALYSNGTTCNGVYVFLTGSTRTADGYKVLSGSGGKWHLCGLDNPYVQHSECWTGFDTSTGSSDTQLAPTPWDEVDLDSEVVETAIDISAPMLYTGDLIVATATIDVVAGVGISGNEYIEYRFLCSPGDGSTVAMTGQAYIELNQASKPTIATVIGTYSIPSDYVWAYSVGATLQHQQAGYNMYSSTPWHVRLQLFQKGVALI